MNFFSNLLTNLSDKLGGTLPNIVGALIILLIGWLIAKGVQTLIVKLLNRSHWEEKLLKDSSNGGETNTFIGKLFYYVLLIITFLIVLEVLGITSVLAPLESMVTAFLGFIPNLIAAIIIGLVGYMIAKIVAELVGAAGGFIAKWVEKTGINKTDKAVKVLKNFVFVIIFVPLLIQAINALRLHSIGDPLNRILSGFIAIIGNVIIAAIILTIFIWGGKLLTKFLKELFNDLGLDSMAEKIQLNKMIGEGNSFSKLIANILYFFIVYFGVVTALQVLQLDRLTGILNQVLDITGAIAFGAVILFVGVFIASLIYNALSKSQNKFVANVVRIAIIGLFLGMALRAMGFANEIVDLAFGLSLGAVAVVVALAYGLGGREAAGEHFKDIIKKLRGKDEN